jgi:hypothetical protein
LIRLSYEDLLRTCTTNKSLSAYCRDDNFWRDFLRNKFPSIDRLPYSYKSWRDYTEVIYTNAKLFTIPKRTLDPSLARPINTTGELLTRAQLDALMEAAAPLLIDARRGDIVHFEDLDFNNIPNIGRFIHNGYGLDDLEYNRDPKGALPHTYNLHEFIDPSRWFSYLPSLNLARPIENNTFVFVSFANGDFEIVDRQSKYIVLRRDSVYYTVTLNEADFEYSNWPEVNVRNYLALVTTYVYDMDKSMTAASIYDEIRPYFKGFILVRQSS